MNSSVRKWQVATVVLFVGLCTIVIHAYWFWDHAAVHVPTEQKKYPLIDPARHLISAEHFLSTLQPLRERVHAVVASEKDLKISVYIEFLNTGANISVNNEGRFAPASLSKVPLALAAMGAIEDGTWKLDQKLTLEELDRAPDPTTLEGYPTGTQFTVERLIEELLVRSDNIAYRILLRNIPQSELDAVREGLGLDELFDVEGQVSAREYSRMFRALYTSSYLGREGSQYLLDILGRAEWKHFLAKNIPETIPFPHKYGLEPTRHTFLDSGIVYVPNRPYLITVMIQTPSTMSETEEGERVDRVMHALSNSALEYFMNAKNSRL